MLVSRVRVATLALVALLALNVYVFVERANLQKQGEHEQRVLQTTTDVVQDCRQQFQLLLNEREQLRKERKDVVVEENGLLLREQRSLDECQERHREIKDKEMNEAVFHRALYDTRRQRNLYLYDQLTAIGVIATLTGKTPGAVLGSDPDQEEVRNTLIAATADHLGCDVMKLQALKTEQVTELALAGMARAPPAVHAAAAPSA